ncbi:hypothetical protein HCBG_08067 [Histoplasma capsulatum G186AR]|uniref:Uncharacterized protein n=1 Tax=Ajellomyces capsulatus (strain G186AR / H82 / ATCC MYA-2454 / RMSCC 2432) TaxID=447093 RepID=C0NX75_AJECG|nr:uncharacterized protein HCBG_08067 [Histoplasma capsulatum G186AR]EEH03941.1 hypothetical protein HCBG_08067 [Histoplasma capsulatum G186AR]
MQGQQGNSRNVGNESNLYESGRHCGSLIEWVKTANSSRSKARPGRMRSWWKLYLALEKHPGDGICDTVVGGRLETVRCGGLYGCRRYLDAVPIRALGRQAGSERRAARSPRESRGNTIHQRETRHTVGVVFTVTCEPPHLDHPVSKSIDFIRNSLLHPPLVNTCFSLLQLSYFHPEQPPTFVRDYICGSHTVVPSTGGANEPQMRAIGFLDHLRIALFLTTKECG